MTGSLRDEEEEADVTTTSHPEQQDDEVRSLSSIPLAGNLKPQALLRSIFLLLGVGVLVPWNAFISAKSYFQSRFCDPNDPDGNNSTMESTFVFVYTLSSVVSLGMIMLGQWAYDQVLANKRRTLLPSEDNEGIFLDDSTTADRREQNTGTLEDGDSSDHGGALQMTPIDEQVDNGEATNSEECLVQETSSSSSSMWFDVIPLSFFLLVFCGQTILVLSVQISSPHSIAFWTYLSLAICGVCSSMATAGIVAVAGRFEDADLAMNPFLAGQSVGGVIVSVANFAAAVSRDPASYWEENCAASNTSHTDSSPYWSYDDTVLIVNYRRELDPTNGCAGYNEIDWGIFVYFFLGSLVLIACLIGFSMIEPLRKKLLEEDTGPSEESMDILRGYQRTGSSLRGVELLRPPTTEEAQTAELGNRPTSRSYLLDGQSDRSTPEEEEDAADPAGILNVLALVRGPTACIFLTFVVTLALFPGWTSELGSVRQCRTHFRLANDLYTPFSFVLFNIGDLTGRLLAGYSISQRLFTGRLVKASLLRVAFFPLLFLCASASSEGPLSMQIHSDVFSLAVQFVFSVSNGLLLTAAFATAPSLLPRNNETMNERMSEILSFSVAIGLLSGSLCSFPVSQLAG